MALSGAIPGGLASIVNSSVWIAFTGVVTSETEHATVFKAITVISATPLAPGGAVEIMECARTTGYAIVIPVLLV
jgi:hypothetical protein